MSGNPVHIRPVNSSAAGVGKQWRARIVTVAKHDGTEAFRRTAQGFALSSSNSGWPVSKSTRWPPASVRHPNRAPTLNSLLLTEFSTRTVVWLVLQITLLELAFGPGFQHPALQYLGLQEEKTVP